MPKKPPRVATWGSWVFLNKNNLRKTGKSYTLSFYMHMTKLKNHTIFWPTFPVCLRTIIWNRFQDKFSLYLSQIQTSKDKNIHKRQCVRILRFRDQLLSPFSSNNVQTRKPFLVSISIFLIIKAPFYYSLVWYCLLLKKEQFFSMAFRGANVSKKNPNNHDQTCS